MRLIVLTFIATAAVCAATTLPSVAQDASAANAPVSVLACDVLDQYASSPDDAGAVIWQDTMVRIAFVNRSTQTIRGVTFRVDANVHGGARTITDVGRFSTGVPIQHTFGPFGDVSYNARCDVAAVTFDDGTVWQRR